MKPVLGALIRYAALALALTTAGGASASPTSPLRTRLTSERAAFGTEESVRVRFALHNDSADDLQVLWWQTPLRRVMADLFDVRRDGQPVAYLGPLAKFAAPVESSWVRVPAGGSISSEVDLESLYDLSKSGTYTVRFRGGVVGHAAGREDSAAVKALSPAWANRVSLQLERSEPQPRVELTAGPRGIEAAPSTSRVPIALYCSASQMSQIQTAHPLAQFLAQDGYDYFAAGSVTTQYTNWFGTFNGARWVHVLGNFTKILGTLKNRTYWYYCNCTDPDVFAFTNKSTPAVITLCGAFWTAPLFGTDSRPGVILHETSHWPVYGGDTDDWAYGTVACQNLADNSPNTAIDNADSYEYFTETMP